MNNNNDSDNRRKRLSETADILMKTKILNSYFNFDDNQSGSVFFGLDTSSVKDLMGLVMNSKNNVVNFVIATQHDAYMEIIAFEKRAPNLDMAQLNPFSNTIDLVRFIGQGRNVQYNGNGYHVEYKGRIPYPSIIDNA